MAERHERRMTGAARAGAYLFAYGIFLTLLMAAIAFWPDMEASLFDAGLDSDAGLTTLRCPLIINPSETAQIAVTFTNRAERPVQFLVRARLSQGSATMMRRTSTVVALEPGETERLSWPASAEDAAYGRVILARVYQFSAYQVPSRQGTCGILVLNLAGVRGRVLAGAGLAAALICLGGGGWLAVRGGWPGVERQREKRLAAALLAGLALLNLAASWLGRWGIGLALTLFTAILLVVLLERYVLSR